MAEAKIKTTVSVEAVLHRTFQRFVQEIAGEYGVQVTDVNFDWVERLGSAPIVQECRVQTKANIGWSVPKAAPQNTADVCPYCAIPLDPPPSAGADPYCHACGYVPPR